MKIYIHTDLEGISGIDSDEMVDRANPRYSYSTGRLMADVNAAIDGAFTAGATHVTVLDSHDYGGNFDISLLDSRADMDLRENKKWWGKLDETYNGTFIVGAHAMAGTLNGFLDHTQSPESWFNYWINGRKMGEMAQWATVSGHFKVPLLMVSGDEAACVEARQFFNPIECAVVKRGLGRNSAELIEPGEAVERIWNAAHKAIALVGKTKPFTPILPMEVKLELSRSDYCDSIANRQGVERLDARTVRKVTNSYLDLLF
jgi:D-amino peptidase